MAIKLYQEGDLLYAKTTLPRLMGQHKPCTWLEKHECEYFVLFGRLPSADEAYTPKWQRWLSFTQDSRAPSPRDYCLIFIKLPNLTFKEETKDRWFAITFGQGLNNIHRSAFKKDFGLRVALNSIDEEKIKVMQTMTSYPSRCVNNMRLAGLGNQAHFRLDYFQTMLKGIGGKPKKGLTEFASSLKGTDQLSVIKGTIKKEELPAICQQAWDLYVAIDYQKHFSWVDNFEIVAASKELKKALRDALNEALQGNIQPQLQLMCPTLGTDLLDLRPIRYKIPYKKYDKASKKYSTVIHCSEKEDEESIESYVKALQACGIKKFKQCHLETHVVEKMFSPFEVEDVDALAYCQTKINQIGIDGIEEVGAESESEINMPLDSGEESTNDEEMPYANDEATGKKSNEWNLARIKFVCDYKD